MSNIPKELEEFVFRRIVEKSGGWQDRKKRQPKPEAHLAYIYWASDFMGEVSPLQAHRQKAYEFRYHRDYCWSWAPDPRRNLTRR